MLMRLLPAIVSALLLLSPALADAKGSGGGSSSGSKSTYVQGYTRKDGTYVAPHYRSAPGSGSSSADAPHYTAPSSPGYGTHGLSGGKQEHNSAARDAFQRKNPCPATGSKSGACQGYVVDHVVPLKRGGADDPSNMQWQTIEAAKAKDRVE